jgi:hypothetical protein
MFIFPIVFLLWWPLGAATSRRGSMPTVIGHLHSGRKMTMEGSRWRGTGGLGLKWFGCSSLAISSELAE